MNFGSITLRPATLAALVVALLLSATCFRLIPELPERNTLAYELRLTDLREMLAQMPTDDTVAVRHHFNVWRHRPNGDDVQYMERVDAERAVARAHAVAERRCGVVETTHDITQMSCQDEYLLEIFDRDAALREVERVQEKRASAHNRTLAFGVSGWWFAVVAGGLAVLLVRSAASPITVDIARGDDPMEAVQRNRGTLVVSLLALGAIVVLLPLWAQSFVEWVDVLSDRGPTYQEVSEKLDVSGLGSRFMTTVVPTYAFVAVVLVQAMGALRRTLSQFEQADPELGVPARVRQWLTSDHLRRAGTQNQLREKYALAHALQTNHASPADLARVADEIRALEEQAARPPPPVEQWLQEVLAALTQKRAELYVLRRNGAPADDAAGAIVELRGRLARLEEVTRAG